MASEETVQCLCASCGQPNNCHRVLHQVVRSFSEGPGEPEVEKEYHRFVECMGCGSLKYVRSNKIDNFDWCQEEFGVQVYPDGSEGRATRSRGIDLHEVRLPDKVERMYVETLRAYEADLKTLAAGGLRATMEAICLDKGVTARTLEKKIDELRELMFLTPAQAELAHEERYLGNAALHELEMPSAQSIEDGLGIVEGLISTIYVLPVKAARLRKVRTDKGSELRE
jgi:hypothetical protein